MKRKTKLKQVIILLLLVFMCVFALSNYKNYKLLKNGYSINEVKEINKNLISDDIKSLIKRNYTKDVIRIIESKKFKPTDRKSTRLNSSHVSISYAVFCLKKKKQTQPKQ